MVYGTCISEAVRNPSPYRNRLPADRFPGPCVLGRSPCLGNPTRLSSPGLSSFPGHIFTKLRNLSNSVRVDPPQTGASILQGVVAFLLINKSTKPSPNSKNVHTFALRYGYKKHNRTFQDTFLLSLQQGENFFPLVFPFDFRDSVRGRFFFMRENNGRTVPRILFDCQINPIFVPYEE